MPKVFTVEKAFLSTQADKKTPQVVQTKGGEMHKYMVQFKDQAIPGWIGILKKPGNSIAEGDEMYGVLEENQWGKPQFTRMQLPQDGSIVLKTSGSTKAAPSKSQPTGTLEEKIDYLTALVEAFINSQDKRAKPPVDNLPSDEDLNKPINLEEIPF